MLEKKDLHGKIISSHLWAKLLIIAVNFGNKTKVFSENFGWLHVAEHLKHKHLAHTCTQLFKSRKQSQKSQQVISRA